MPPALDFILQHAAEIDRKRRGLRELGRAVERFGDRGKELWTLLDSVGGVVAFDFALVIRPAATTDGHIGIPEWNARDLWRSAYADVLGEKLFFAEDLFGNQWALDGDSVVAIDAESGHVTRRFRTLEEWTASVVSNIDVMTGRPLGASWQKLNRPLRAGERLVPKLPFVLGGAFDCSNLIPMPDSDGMRVRGELAVLLRDVPDGTSVSFEIDRRPRHDLE